MMNNDEAVSELISKSLRTRLDESESNALDAEMERNESTRRFAKLSTAIHESVSKLGRTAAEGQTQPDISLSEEAKSRLKGSVRAMLDSNTRGPDQLEQDVPVAGDEQSALRSGRRGRVEFGFGKTQEFVGNRIDSLESDEYAVSENHPESKVGDLKKFSSRLRLVRKLGEGGLGNVWLARDEKLRRNVAVKQMNPDSMELHSNWQRFRREAEITGQLEHPNIVPLYQYGIDSLTNEPFYAMRFVGKRTLANAIEEYHARRKAGEEQELELHRLLNSFLDVCQAIAYAHSRGVIHRDLKPENVALNNFGQVIVLDWGLAKLIDDSDLLNHVAGDSLLDDATLAKTMVGEVIGTPMYMAPEQAAGDLHSIDERTDIYGLGAILFSILTGVAPHEKSCLEIKGSELNVQKILGVIVDSDTPQPRDFVSTVPRVLEKICMKAMAKKSYSRFESAAELATIVERWMAGQSEKQTRYESMRMEGRELRADMEATVRDLETNVRFMLRLPPVQELIESETEEELTSWRGRLATIFKGLLSAQSDYRTVAYCRVDGDELTELVRVERHSTEHSNIRSIPKSRLKNKPVSDCIRNVLNQNPEEVITSLACNPMCDDNACERTSLIAGAPVYNEKTEEPFGIIMIECDIDRVFEKQMNRRLMSCEVIAACDTYHVLMHNKGRRMVDESRNQPIETVASKYEQAVEVLQTQNEYIDETDQEIYGARLWLIPKKHGIMYLLSSSEGKLI